MAYRRIAPIATDRRRGYYDTIEVTAGQTLMGVRYDKGVMIAADTLVCFGHEKSFPNEQRVFKINENIVMGGCGDHADFQYARNLIDVKMVNDFSHGEPNLLRPNMMANWLSELLYNRYEEKDPLSFEMVIGGIQHDGKSYLGAVDRFGGFYEDFVLTAGNADICLPMSYGRKPPGREYNVYEAAELIVNNMTLLFYRNCGSINNYMVAICDRHKSGVYGPFQITEHWEVAKIVHGY